MDTPNIYATAIKKSIHEKGENPVHSEEAIHLEVTNDGAGPFMLLSQGQCQIEITLEQMEVIIVETRTMLDEYNISTC